MKRLSAVAATLIIVTMSVAMISSVNAGVEPSPFRSHTNKLQSVATVLGSTDMRLEGILFPPYDVGIIGMLEAMSMQLMVLHNRTGKVIGMLPEDTTTLPADTMDALNSVRLNASRIMENEQGGFEVPPDEIVVIAALMMVEMASENIVMTVNMYQFPPG